MSLEFRKKMVVLTDVVGVEDAEQLLQWLQNKTSAKVDLSACTHLHPANIQVLMAAGVMVAAWPADPALTNWLKTALVTTH